MVEAMEMVERSERFEQRRRNEEEEDENEVIKWESDIPSIVVRVLLVEADDSTRQIVTALLRKCGYRVSAVSDGLKAWELLKERAQSIDLILTEMDLPSISGFALLSLVMEDNICKEIPVIMMSSRDPITMVFKCMLKGAVDYLIKPLRRNELSNLWQHVWRRNSLLQRQFPQNSTAQEQTPEPAFENNLPGNCSNGSLGSAPNSNYCTEKGGDSQSSYTGTSTYLEDISQLHRKSGSKCTETNVEKMNEDLVLDVSDTREKSNLFKPEVVSCNRALKSTVLRLEEDHICTKRVKLDESVCANIIYESCDADDDDDDDDDLADRSGEAVDLIGIIGEHPRCNKDRSVVDDVTNSSEYPLRLELSLRRNLSRGSNSQVTDEGSKLKHSNPSAFSWYNSSTMQPLFAALPNGFTKSDEASKKSEDSSLLNQYSSENSVNGCSWQRGRSTVHGQSKHSHVLSPPPSPQQLGTVLVKDPRFDTKSIDQPDQDHNDPELSEGFGSEQSNVVGIACNGSNKTSVEADETDINTVIGDGKSPHEKFRGMDSDWINQREASLAKFRTKRKDRCFVKKVRYQSRKNLAEQRPRVKGQFVRQHMQTDPSSSNH